MAVELTNTSAHFLGTGAPATYTPEFYARDDDQVAVYVDDVLQTIGDDYVLNGLGASAGVSIDATFPLAADVFIERLTPITQEIDTQNNETILEDVIDAGFDKLTMIDQEQQTQLDRAVQVPRGSSGIIFDPTALGDGDLLEYRGGQLQRLDPSPFVGKFYGGDAAGRLIPLSGTGNDAAFRADAAGSGGSALIGFIAAGAGAVARTMQGRMREEIRLTDFLPTGYVDDGSVDYSVQIRAAIAACGHLKNLRFPQGTFQFRQDGANPWGLLKYASNRWIGDSKGHTILYPFGLPDTCDAVREIPSPAYLNRGGGCSDIAIRHPINGTRSGRHGWYIDTTMALAVPDLQINGHLIERLSVGTPTAVTPGYGLCHANDPALNLDGGMYGSTFRDLDLVGGYGFFKTGDSITLRDVRTSGPLPNYIENIVMVAGSSNTFLWDGGNATNAGGLLQIVNAPGLVVTSLNGEAFFAGPGALNGAAAVWFKAPAAYNGATVYVTGDMVTYANKTYRALRGTVADQPDISPLDWILHDPHENAQIRNSLLSISGAFDGTHVVRIGCGDLVTVNKCRMGIGLGGILGFNVGAGATRADLRGNTWTNGVTEANKLSNVGTDTQIDTTGAVVQITSKATGVALNTATGTITTHNAALAANTSVGFQLTNSLIGANDTIAVSIASGPASGDSYLVTVDAIAAGSCRISLRNVTAGPLAEAIVIRFKVLKERS